MKKIISILLCVMLVLSVSVISVSADYQNIKNISVSAPSNKLFVGSQFKTEGDILNAFRRNFGGMKSDLEGWKIDVSYSRLCYREGTEFKTISRGSNSATATNPYNSSRTYYMAFNFEEISGFQWNVNTLPVVRINGSAPEKVEWYSQAVAGSVDAYYKIPVNTSANAVWSINIDPLDCSVQKGKTQQFTATVGGTATGVKYTLSSSSSMSSNTKLSSSGLLTVGADETASYVYVTATSTYDANITVRASVKIVTQTVKIDSITIDNTETTAMKGSDTKINVTVKGTDALDYTLSVSGNKSTSTYASGTILHVAENETATTLTVTATAVRDTTKKATKTFTVVNKPTVRKVAVTCDMSLFALSVSKTGREVTTEIKNALSPSGGDEAYVDKSYSGLYYKENGIYYSLKTSDATLTTGREYYLGVNIEERSGYAFDPDNIPSVTINGRAADDVQWYSQTTTGSIVAYYRVVLPNGTFSSISISPSTTTCKTGSSITFTVSVVATGTIPKGYTLSVSGNTSSNTVFEGNVLKVDTAEKATKLTVTATSVYNPGKKATATVNVVEIKTAAKFNITFPSGTLTFDEGTTVGDAVASIRSKLTCATNTNKGSGEMYVDTNYIFIVTHNSTTSKYDQLLNTEVLSGNKTYYVMFNVEEISGYEFNINVFPNITVNGAAPLGLSWFSRTPTGSVDVRDLITINKIDNVITETKIDFNGSFKFTPYADAGDMINAIVSTITSKTENGTSEPTYVDTEYVYIAYFDNGSIRYLNFNDLIRPNIQYYAVFNLENSDGFIFDTAKLPKVVVNGKDTAYAVKWYNGINANGSIDVFVAIETAKLTSPYPDVKNPSDWFYDAVMYVSARGIFSGYANGYFGVSDNIQRQDFLVALARFDGVNLNTYTGNGNFKDVKSTDYFAKAVVWAVNKGITTGYTDGSGKFGVGDKMTREQLVTFLYRYAKMKNYDITPSHGESHYANIYEDMSKVSPFAKDAIIWALDKGVISGKNPTHIEPQGNAQRCEVAKIFYNIFLNGVFTLAPM